MDMEQDDPNPDTYPDIPPVGPWAKLGACRGMPTAMFFPEGFPGAAAPARTICAGCPVLDDCREWAMPHPVVRGIWGGTTDEERQHERARRGILTSRSTHGIRATYVRGCRCGPCRDAAAAYELSPERKAYNRRRMAEWRQARRAQEQAAAS